MMNPLLRSIPLAGVFALLAASACTSSTIDCPETDTLCGEICVNTKLDPAHCGACGAACDALHVCQSGECVCPAGQDCDPQACGGTCSTGEHCIGDTCVAGDVFAACFQAGSVVPLIASGLAVAGAPYPGLEGAQALAALGAYHLVAAGSLDSVLHSVDRTSSPMTGATLDLLPTGGAVPNQIVVRGSFAYVVNSAVNTVERIDLTDPSAPEVAGEASTGAGTNPYGAAFDAQGTLWVSLWITDEVVPVTFDEATGMGTAGDRISITLPQGEGKPYPAGVAAIGDAVYVTLNNLGPDYAPAGTGGKLAVISGGMQQAIVDLGAECTNPGFTATAGTTLWIACTGSYGKGDGQVVAVDTTTRQVTRRVKTGGAPSRLSAGAGAGLWAADAASLDVIHIPDGRDPIRVTACPEGMLEFVGDVLAF